MEEATEFIPAFVTAIAAYWRGKGSTQISMPSAGQAGNRRSRLPTGAFIVGNKWTP